jgi:hypothetical protein
VVILFTTSLTFSSSTFCPHSVFMCFVWISEQTAIISLYSINWLVCINETECVYCAVRTGCLYIIQVNLSLARYTKSNRCYGFKKNDLKPERERERETAKVQGWASDSSQHGKQRTSVRLRVSGHCLKCTAFNRLVAADLNHAKDLRIQY